MTPTHWILTQAGQDQPITGSALLITGAMPRIEVIAHSLGQINRFTGHASRPYSVAEHSVLVCDILAGMGHGPHAQLAGLMHDAHECVCGDVASPVKWAIGTAWIALENPLALLMRKHYHLQAAYTGNRQHIKRADLIALATERRDLMRFAPTVNLPWPILDTPGAEVLPMENVDLNTPVRAAISWRHHRDAFLERYQVLTAQCMGVPALMLDASLQQPAGVTP